MFTPCANGSGSGTLKVLQRLNRYTFAVEVAVIREGLNVNRWDYRNLDNYWNTFIGQPILIAYVGGKIGDGHNMRETITAEGDRVYTFTDGTAERIIGTLSEDEKDFRVEERGGNKWLIAKGKIYTFYAREAVEKIVATGAMDVSAETDVFRTESGPNGSDIFTEWAGIGVTILGDDVPPAIPGARIKALKTLREDVEGLRLRAASLIREEEAESAAPPENTKKGVKKPMDKREIARLQPMFEGYTVLGGDGLHVCLMNNADFSLAGYTFNPDDGADVVVPDRIKRMSAETSFAFGEDKVDLDVYCVLDDVSARLMAANADNEKKAARIEELEGQIRSMQDKEHARRIDAAKSAVNAKLREMNACRVSAEQFNADLAEKVCGMVDSGKFLEDEEDGKWCGDRNAVSCLLSLCMEEQTRIDHEKAQRTMRSNSWEDMLGIEKNAPADNEDKLMAFLESK